jgi:hypothetical protein
MKYIIGIFIGGVFMYIAVAISLAFAFFGEPIFEQTRVSKWIEQRSKERDNRKLLKQYENMGLDTSQVER